MVTNAFFYTLSTIAQTLAGAIALLSALVLYRLQMLGVLMQEDSHQLSWLYGSSPDHTEESEAIRNLHQQSKYSEVLNFIALNPIPQGVNEATAERARLKQNLERQNALLKLFAFALILTVGLIAASVSALAAAATIEPMMVSLLRIAIGWFMICLVTYARLAWVALR